jgi:hypothetical protein
MTQSRNATLMSNNQRRNIDLNLSTKERLNMSARSKYYSINKNNAAPAVPISNCIDVTDPNEVINNTYMQLSTGDLIPARYLPKTAFENLIQPSLNEELYALDGDSSQTQTIAYLVWNFSTTDGKIEKYGKYINNSTGKGWFSNGFLGTEHFDETGFKEWSVIKEKKGLKGLPKNSIISKIKLGEFNENVTLYNFNTGYNDWYVYKSYTLGKSEIFDDGFSEGATPSQPCNSSDSLTTTENLSSQITGSDYLFKTSNMYESKTLHVYWNGIRQTSVQITEINSTTFRTSFVPVSSDVLLVDYIPI